MRLPNGIVLDQEKTFGMLKFSALRREKFIREEDGSPTTEVVERTYDLKSIGQGLMIQVSIPESAGLKEFAYNQLVTLINPVIDTVAEANFRGATTSWYIKADDIVIPGSKAKITNDKK